MLIYAELNKDDYDIISYIIPCTCPCTLTNKLRKILRKEKLKNIR